MSEKPTVLIVDDDEFVRRTASTIFQKLGATVYQAHSADAALSLMRQMGEMDLVFSDVRMPDKNGVYLAEQVIKLFSKTRVILTSAEPVADAPANVRVVAKPWQLRELRQLL